jgi:outer membrane protein
MKKMILAALLGSTSLIADTIAGGEVSIGYYSHTPNGTASYSIGSVNPDIDLEDDFGWSTTQDVFAKAYIEHPVPMLPNIRLAYAKFDNAGEANVIDFSWGNINLFTGTISTDTDMAMFDATLYYELLDNWLSLDAGLTLRYIDGNINVGALVSTGPITSPTLSETTDFSLWLPMLYGKARFDIPNTDISMQLEGNVISYEDTTLYDYEISARYTLSMGLGIEGGYKGIHLDSTDDLTDGLAINADFRGPYVAVVWDF